MSRAPRRVVWSLLAALTLGAPPITFALTISSPAAAALTSSEREQVRQFVATALPANAARVRALVARTDLSADEAYSALREGLAVVPFNDARATFVRELLFGGASSSARASLAPVVVRALLGRADAVYAKHGAELETRADGLSELAKIYGFLASEIANAGHPRGAAHDPAAGIPDSAYDDCARHMAEHIAARPTWLKASTVVGPNMLRVRAQLQLAFYEMLNDTPTRRLDAADKLGMMGARRAMLIETGVVLLDSGQADDARVAKLRALLDRLPSARTSVEAYFVGDARGVLRARGEVLAITTALEGAAASPVLAWHEDVEAPAADDATSALAVELAAHATRLAFARRGELRVAADLDARAAAGDARKTLGSPVDASAEATIAAAVALVATDAPRAMDLAFIRFVAGRPESAALLSDALGVMAVDAAAGTLRVGHVKSADGATESWPATAVRLAPNGTVVELTLAGKTWEITRDAMANGNVTSVKRDGAPVTTGALGNARVPLSDATMWQQGKLVFARLQGTPRAGIAPGPRIRLLGVNAKGFDAIATVSPGADVAVEADIRVEKDLGGLVLRALSDRDAFRGVSVLIAPSSPPRVLLLASDGSGNEVELAPAADLPFKEAHHVKMIAKGSVVEATVSGVALKGAIPVALAAGDIAIRAKRGANVEVSGLVITRAR